VHFDESGGQARDRLAVQLAGPGIEPPEHQRVVAAIACADNRSGSFRPGETIAQVDIVRPAAGDNLHDLAVEIENVDAALFLRGDHETFGRVGRDPDGGVVRSVPGRIDRRRLAHGWNTCDLYAGGRRRLAGDKA